MRAPFDLLLITPERSPAEILERTSAALSVSAQARGRLAVQLRSKQLSAPERSQLAYALQALCVRHRVPLLINGDIALARAIGAAGMQLPERGPSVAAARTALGPAAWLGASRHDDRGVREAALAGATFVLVSPVFAVPGKNAPLGLDGLHALAAHSRIPVVALGGIDAQRVQDVRGSGASAIAVVREVFDAADPAAATLALLPARAV